MSLRLSILALVLIAFLMLLLLNIGSVPLRFFFVELQIPLFSVIALSSMFGVFVAWVFISLGTRERRLQAKVKNYEKSVFRNQSEDN